MRQNGGSAGKIGPFSIFEFYLESLITLFETLREKRFCSDVTYGRNFNYSTRINYFTVWHT